MFEHDFRVYKSYRIELSLTEDGYFYFDIFTDKGTNVRKKNGRVRYYDEKESAYAGAEKAITNLDKLTEDK